MLIIGIAVIRAARRAARKAALAEPRRAAHTEPSRATHRVLVPTLEHQCQLLAHICTWLTANTWGKTGVRTC